MCAVVAILVLSVIDEFRISNDDKFYFYFYEIGQVEQANRSNTVSMEYRMTLN